MDKSQNSALKTLQRAVNAVRDFFYKNLKEPRSRSKNFSKKSIDTGYRATCFFINFSVNFHEFDTYQYLLTFW